MPFDLPRLDDRTYRDLVEEGLRIVGSGGGEWTNYNPSDPGITVLELLAYVTELLTYRASRITDDDIDAFARLLGAPSSDVAGSSAERLTAAVIASRRRERLVTADDYESAALSVDPVRIARAHCVVDRDLTLSTAAARHAYRPGHMTVLLVLRHDDDAAAVCARVRDYLDARRLVTTRVHVGVPDYVDLGIRLSVGVAPGASPTAVRGQVRDALAKLLDPAVGGPKGEGWPLGRSVYVSEIYRAIDDLPGVDYVTRVIDPRTKQPLDELLVASGRALERLPDTREIVALRLEPHQMVRARPDAISIHLDQGSADLPPTPGA